MLLFTSYTCLLFTIFSYLVTIIISLVIAVMFSQLSPHLSIYHSPLSITSSSHSPSSIKSPFKSLTHSQLSIFTFIFYILHPFTTITSSFHSPSITCQSPFTPFLFIIITLFIHLLHLSHSPLPFCSIHQNYSCQVTIHTSPIHYHPLHSSLIRH